MDRTTGQPTQQLRSWVNDASPDDLIDIGKAVLARIGTFDQTYQDRFFDAVNNDPTASRLLKQHA